MPSERFMKQYYGASGFVDKTANAEEVPEEIRVAVVRFCRERDLDYTLGTMLEMARFAHQFTERLQKTLRLTEEAAGRAEIRAINAENVRRRRGQGETR